MTFADHEIALSLRFDFDSMVDVNALRDPVDHPGRTWVVRVEASTQAQMVCEELWNENLKRRAYRIGPLRKQSWDGRIKELGEVIAFTSIATYPD